MCDFPTLGFVVFIVANVYRND